jgi:WD40 repeat protein
MCNLIHHTCISFVVTKPLKAHKYNPRSIWKVGRFSHGVGKAVTDLAFSPNGLLVAISSLDGCLRIISFPEERYENFSFGMGAFRLKCLCGSFYHIFML